MIDYYAVLGASPHATPDEIKSAYRRAARRCHPDAQGGAAGSEAFQQVQTAYEVLGQAERRAAYDRQRQDWMAAEGLIECPHCGAANRTLRSPGAGVNVRCGRCKATLLLPFAAQMRAARQDLSEQFAALYDEVGGQMATLAADGIRSGFAYVRDRIERRRGAKDEGIGASPNRPLARK